MARLPLALALCFCLSAVSLLRSGELRTWTDQSGKHQLEGEFIEIVDGKVRLKKKDGGIASIKLSRLKKEDQQYLRQLIRQQRKGIPSKKSSPSKRPPRTKGVPKPIRSGSDAEVKLDGEWVSCRVMQVSSSNKTAVVIITDHEIAVKRLQNKLPPILENIPFSSLRELKPSPPINKSKRNRRKATEYRVGELIEIKNRREWKPAIVIEGGFANGKDNWLSYRLFDKSSASSTFRMDEVRPLKDQNAIGAGQVMRPDYTLMKRITPRWIRTKQVDPDETEISRSALMGQSIELLDHAGMRLQSFSVTPSASHAIVLSSQRGFSLRDEKSPPLILSVVDIAAKKVKLTVPVDGLELSPYRSIHQCRPDSSANRIAVQPEVITHKGADLLAIYEIRKNQARRVALWEPFGHLEHGDVEWFQWIDDDHLLVRNSHIGSGDYLICWRISDLTPLYQIHVPDSRNSEPVISPGRKQIFISAKSAISVFNSATGEHLADIGQGLNLNSDFDLSEDGKLLAGTRGNEIIVVDVAMGSIVGTVFSEQRLTGSYLEWIASDYLLALAVVDQKTGSCQHQLYDWTTRSVWWRYIGMGGDPKVVGQEVWVVKSNKVVSYAIPDEAAIQGRQKFSEDESIAVHSGAGIKLDVSDCGSPEFQIKCKEYLRIVLNKAGYKVTESSPIRLVASLEDLETKDLNFLFTDQFITYEGTERNINKTIPFTVRKYRLELFSDDESVWERERTVEFTPQRISSRPGQRANKSIMVRLGEEETIEEAVERVTVRWPGYFGQQLPKSFVYRKYTKPLGESAMAQD